MLGADVVGNHAGIFQVDGVGVHADGEGADLVGQEPRGDGADQTAVEAAGEQKAQRRVRVQTLFHALGELIMDGLADGLQIVFDHLAHLGHVGIADKFPVCVIVARREGQDLVTEPHQVLRLAGKDDAAGSIIAVIQRPDADGISGGHKAIPLPVIEHHGELRVQHPEHLQPVFPVQRQEDLAVGAAFEGVALFLQLLFHRAEAVELTVADAEVVLQMEGLHAALLQTHDGESVEAETALPCRLDAGQIRAPGFGAIEIRPHLIFVQNQFRKAHDGTHSDHTPCFLIFPFRAVFGKCPLPAWNREKKAFGGESLTPKEILASTGERAQKKRQRRLCRHLCL